MTSTSYYFISHMVQIILGTLEFEGTLVTPSFISHMVQIILDYDMGMIKALSSFISHMVQIIQE